MSVAVPRITIAVAASFTAEPLQKILEKWLSECGLASGIQFAPYQQVFQQLLDPASLLAGNAGGLNLVLVRACDFAADSPGRARELAGELAAALGEFSGRSAVQTLVAVCPQADHGDEAREFAEVLEESVRGMAGVRWLEAAELGLLYPVADPFDLEADQAAHVPYSEEMFAALGTWLARRIAGIRRKPYKVIAVDCDQTLWTGVCGELGASGVVVDEARRGFQRFLMEKRADGYLLCLVSKNHPEDVEAVFREHPGMLIPRDAFVDAEIHWGVKSGSLRALAGRLGVGLDSIILLDDNPAEVGEVEANAPAVLALKVPDEAAELDVFVRHLWVLDAVAGTAEDEARANFYQVEVLRNELRAKAAGFEEFLAGLRLEVMIEPLVAADAARASQLTLRTNQFHAAPVVLDEAGVMAAAGRGPALVVRVRDRFGDYGLVGLMLGREEAGRLVVETFLLSCRALGKGVEHRMLAHLGQVARGLGLGEVAIVYRDSGRNEPCRAFLAGLGEARWEGGLRVVPVAVAEGCRMQAGEAVAQPVAGEADGPLVDPAWTAKVAAEFSNVAAIVAELRGGLRARPEIGEVFVVPQGADEERVAAVWREVLRLEAVGRNDRFADLGGSSLELVRVHAALQRAFGRRFELVRMFEHPTVAGQARLAAGTAEGEGAGRLPIGGRASASGGEGAGDSRAVAVIGMALRLPGASTPEELWRNLRDGVESITHFDPSELEVPARDGEDLVCARGLLDPELFEGMDGGLFGIVPREAEMIDPQQRVFLEICWEAIERAGYVPDAAEADGCRVGVYAGCYYDTYLPHHILSDPEIHRRHLAEAQVGALQIEFGNDKDHLATRVAFKLNLHGPSLTVQTACSTSLVAVAHAMMALRSGQCDMALAGGVTITVPQKRGYRHVEGGMLSQDGHCRPFDIRSSGTVFSNGAGVVMLKRLDDALRDGDPIHAVLRGFGLNNDGGVKHSYAAPSVDGQADVIRRAHLDAGVDPRTITCIEAHGTATPLGDPIEIAGLTAAFDQATADRGFCAIGSLKSNLGHLDTAAGVCGLIKTVLSLKHGELPAVLHFSEANPRIDFANSPFFVNDRLRPWVGVPGVPRRAGVSSFGVGGTNAHVVLEEAPVVERPPSGVGGGKDRVLVFSARDEAALEQLAGRLAAHASQADDVDFAPAARTLALGRKAMGRRSAVVAGSWAEAAEALSAAERLSANAAGAVPELVWMFPGQGAQHPGMMADLYSTEAGFREDIDRCAGLLRDSLGEDLREALFAPEGAGAAARLKHTVLAQPAIFVAEYALARQWQRWGVEPGLMLGHSVGEFTAACLAGVFSLEDGLRILAARGRLMGEIEAGSMLSVRLPADELRKRLPAGLDMAAENGPSLCVVAGPVEEVARFAAVLEGEGVAVRPLHTSHAFHSRMMDPVVGRFREVIEGVALSAPGVPILSTVTGRLLSDAEACDPGYWAAHLRRTVLFHQAVDQAAAAKEGRIFVEVGPGQSLTMLARQTAGRRAAACLPSCGAAGSRSTGRRCMRMCLRCGCRCRRILSSGAVPGCHAGFPPCRRPWRSVKRVSQRKSHPWLRMSRWPRAPWLAEVRRIG